MPVLVDGIEQQRWWSGIDLVQVAGQFTAILDELRVVLVADRAHLVPVDDPVLDVIVAHRAVLEEMQAGHDDVGCGAAADRRQERIQALGTAVGVSEDQVGIVGRHKLIDPAPHILPGRARAGVLAVNQFWSAGKPFADVRRRG